MLTTMRAVLAHLTDRPGRRGDSAAIAVPEDLAAARAALVAALAVGPTLGPALQVVLAELRRLDRIEVAARAWADEPVPLAEAAVATTTSTPAADHLLDVLADTDPANRPTCTT